MSGDAPGPGLSNTGCAGSPAAKTDPPKKADRAVDLASLIPAATAVYKCDTGFLTVSDAVGKILGVSFSFLGGLEQFTRLRALRPDGTPYSLDEWPFMRTLATGEFVRDEEMHIVRDDGSVVLALVSSFRTTPGSQGNIIIIIKDVTGQQRLVSDLGQAEEESRLLLEASPNPSFVIDAAGTILALNQALADRHGGSVAGLLGKSIYDQHPKEAARFLKMRHERAIRTKKQVRFEFKQADTWFESTIYPVVEETGGVGRLIIYAYDITKRKQMEEELLEDKRLREGAYRIFREAMECETEEELALVCLSVVEEVTESRFGFIGEIGPDDRLHDLAISNPGWSECEMVDKAGHRTPVASFAMRGLYGRVLNEGKSFVVNHPASHPDRAGLPEGHPMLTAFLGAPLVDREKTVGIVAVANREGGYRAKHRHMAETLAPAILQSLLRKRAERAVRQSEEQFRALINASSDVLYRMSPDWSEMRQLYGHDFLDDMEKSTDTWLQKYIHEDDRPRVAAAIEEAVRTKGVFELEHRVYRKDGTTGWTFSRAVPVKDENGEIIEWFGTASDITERKRAERALHESEARYRALSEDLHRSRDELEQRVTERTEELQRAYDRLLDETRQRHEIEEQLHQAQKMEAVGTLAGGIAHDFNNMLAVIIGNAELALDDVPDSARSVRHEIAQILKASKRARELVKQILTFSRKSDKITKPLSVTPVIKETVKFLRGSLPSMIDVHLNILTESDVVLADPSQIQQVLMNLSTNAAHAMRDDGGVLTIELSDETYREGDPLPDGAMAAGAYVRLTVRDTGAGMTADVSKRVFEPFFTTKQPGEGTGMGLAVVFGIVNTLGGAITVESRTNQGSTFTVFMPLWTGAAEDERPEEGRLLGGREKVLIVDDEASVVEVVSKALTRLGYQVTTADGGPEGWRTFEAEPGAFDLVITDHVMPEMTGMRLAEKMLDARKDIPIILFTGYGETVSAEKAREAGISEFLMKPVVATELATAVRRALDEKSRTRDLTQSR